MERAPFNGEAAVSPTCDDYLITQRYSILKPPRKQVVAIKLLAQRALSTGIKDRFAALNSALPS
jgi:hypothetical protein